MYVWVRVIMSCTYVCVWVRDIVMYICMCGVRHGDIVMYICMCGLGISSCTYVCVGYGYRYVHMYV